MTSEQNPRKKFNALFFSAIMVFSMVATAGAAFAGGAAAANAGAANDINLDGQDSITLQENASQEVDINFGATDLNNNNSGQTVTFNLTLGGNANFTSVSNVQVLNATSGDNIGTSSSGEVLTPTGEDSIITFAVEKDELSYGVNVTVEDATIQAGSANDADLTIDINDSGGDDDTIIKPNAVTVNNAAPVFELDNVSPQVITAEENGTFDVSVDVENTGQAGGNQTITLQDFGAISGPETEEVTNLGPGESDTVTFNDVQISANTGQKDSYTFDIDSGNDTATGTLIVGDSVDGDLAVEVRGDFDPEFDDPATVALFPTGADLTDESNAIAISQTGPDGVAEFRGLPVTGQNESEGIGYTAVGAFGDDAFSSANDQTVLWNNRRATSLTVFVDREVFADEINIDDVRPDDRVEPGTDIEIDTEVLTQDRNTPGELGPFPNNQVSASLTDSNADEVDGVSESDLTFDSTAETGEDGIATFEASLTGVSEDSIDEDVEFTLEFTPEDAEDDSVVATQTITFTGEPPSGDGFLSGDVDQIDNSLPVGAQSENAGSAEDVTVHAVNMDRVVENTDTVNASSGTTYVRVVNATSGNVLDVQTDYLITPDNVALTANTSLPETGFNVVADSAASTNFSVHVLEAGDYTIETSSDGTFTTPSTQTFTADNDITFDATEERYSDVSADQTDVTGADGEFVLANLFTDGTAGQDYAVIAGDGNGNLGFANGAGYDTGVTVEQSSAPGQDDVALAVQQVEVDADSVDIVNIGRLTSASEATDAYADSLISPEQGTDDDVRQVIPRDGSSVDVIDVTTFLEEGDSELGANVTLTYTSTSGSFDGAFLDTAVNGSVVSHSADEITVNTEDGNAVVFLETDNAGLNSDADVTINAAMENAGGTDSTDKLFEGVLDQEFQSGSITGVVSDSNDNPVDARIYVNELVDEDANVSVTFAPDDPNELDNFTATVFDSPNPNTGDVVETVNNITADEMRNFEFQNFESDLALAAGEESFKLFADRAADRTTLSPVPAVAADPGVSLSLTGVSETGETGESVSTAIEVNRTSTGSIVIRGVTPASFSVADLDPQEFTAGPDEEFNVSATVTNDGDLSATQNIELQLNGSVADTQSLTLDAGATETVTFEVDASTIPAGTYEHSIVTDSGDEVNGTLVVQEAASFSVADLDPQEFTAGPDEEFNVSATVTNDGDLSATQEIELQLNGSVADTQSLTLDAGATETVTFEVNASEIEAGTYEHSIASADDEVNGTLVVQEANGSAESPVNGVTQEQFDAVLPNGTDTTLGELRASVGDWSDDEQVDGVSLTLGELRAIVDYWAANQ